MSTSEDPMRETFLWWVAVLFMVSWLSLGGALFLYLGFPWRAAAAAGIAAPILPWAIVMTQRRRQPTPARPDSTYGWLRLGAVGVALLVVSITLGGASSKEGAFLTRLSESSMACAFLVIAWGLAMAYSRWRKSRAWHEREGQ
ncbi:hypothetical protein [Streptomyces sp. NPDC048142]|uniref:hypothetical protein n=1 Tax=Streptomyces sp. NPDC048142 TaxID=3365501 RepID=UPI003715E94D